MDSIVVCWLECIFVLAKYSGLQIHLQPRTSLPTAQFILGYCYVDLKYKQVVKKLHEWDMESVY